MNTGQINNWTEGLDRVYTGRLTGGTDHYHVSATRKTLSVHLLHDASLGIYLPAGPHPCGITMWRLAHCKGKIFACVMCEQNGCCNLRYSVYLEDWICSRIFEQRRVQSIPNLWNFRNTELNTSVIERNLLRKWTDFSFLVDYIKENSFIDIVRFEMSGSQLQRCPSATNIILRESLHINDS